MPEAVINPTEDGILTFAGAAFLLALKDTKGATRRCRKRTQRAVDRAAENVVPLFARSGNLLIPALAIDSFVRGCAACRKCKGITPPPS